MRNLTLFKETFKKWKIVEFNEWDTLGDGSTIFRFTTSDDSEIGILVPTIRPYYPHSNDPFKVTEPIVFPQVIYLHFERQLYCVEKGGEIETILLAMLDLAAKELKGVGPLHPKYIQYLRDVVKSRAIPIYHDCPFDNNDIEGQQGGADQPATAPQLKSEGKGKPKPKSEVRPQ
jgi:hypothetical protein